jgi:hypothetical protein
MYRFHISYKNHNISNDYFLRGVNIILNTNDFKVAVDQFYAGHDNCEIVGMVVVINN